MCSQHGRPARYETQLFTRGNLQPSGSSRAELHTSVACIELVFITLAVAAACGRNVQQVDIKNAFLYADLLQSDGLAVRLPSLEGIKTASR